MAKTDQPHQPLGAVAPDDVSVAFRDAMGRLAAGIVMVTTYVDGRPWGVTVSACCSVTVAPPMLLVSLGTTTTSARAIADSGRFGVSILGEHLIDTARFGSARDRAKFVERFCAEDSELGTPVIADAISHVDCEVERSLEAVDHTIFLGNVRHVVHGPEDVSPLVYHGRRYHRLSVASDLGAAPGPNIWW